MNGALKWSNAYNNKTYNNKKGQQEQRCLYNCMKLLFLLSFCCSMLLSFCLNSTFHIIFFFLERCLQRSHF